MPFRPRMEAQTHALRTLRPLSWRRWPGVVADVWHVRGERGGGGFYLSPDPRVVVFLDSAPASFELRTEPGGMPRAGVSAFYIPPKMPLWSRLRGVESFAHLDLHLEAGPLAQRMRASGADLDRPRLLFEGGRVRQIGAMMAGEVEMPARADLMLDGLLSALLAEVFALPATSTEGRGLAPRQRAAVRRHMQANLGRRVPIEELAEIAGLSESWFARAFKASEGETVQRWQTRLRVEAAAELMLETPSGLAEIAYAAGFADQAHLTRAFRAFHGQPPSQWRRAHTRAASNGALA